MGKSRSTMDPNIIAVELLCPLCKTLPVDPVSADDGRIYEKKALDRLNNENSKHGTFPPKTYFQLSQIKLVIEKLVSTGKVNNDYLGRWAFGNNESDKKGLGNGEKFSEDISFIKEQAKNGDAKNMIKLGELLMKGNGVEKSENEAYFWFDLASEHGDELGTVRKADCLIMGVGAHIDRDGGYNLLTEAARNHYSGEIRFDVLELRNVCI